MISCGKIRSRLTSMELLKTSIFRVFRKKGKNKQFFCVPFKREYDNCPSNRVPFSFKIFALELPCNPSFSKRHSPSASGATYISAFGQSFAQLEHPNQCWRFGAKKFQSIEKGYFSKRYG